MFQAFVAVANPVLAVEVVVPVVLAVGGFDGDDNLWLDDQDSVVVVFGTRVESCFAEHSVDGLLPVFGTGSVHRTQLPLVFFLVYNFETAFSHVGQCTHYV